MTSKVMISIHDFKHLPFDQKCNYITTCADFLVYRVESDRKYYLYYGHSYFIEVSYAPYENKVLGIDAFVATAELEPYLDFINLAELSV